MARGACRIPDEAGRGRSGCDPQAAQQAPASQHTVDSSRKRPATWLGPPTLAPRIQGAQDLAPFTAGVLGLESETKTSFRPAVPFSSEFGASGSRGKGLWKPVCQALRSSVPVFPTRKGRTFHSRSITVGGMEPLPTPDHVPDLRAVTVRPLAARGSTGSGTGWSRPIAICSSACPSRHPNSAAPPAALTERPLHSRLEPRSNSGARPCPCSIHDSNQEASPPWLSPCAQGHRFGRRNQSWFRP